MMMLLRQPLLLLGLVPRQGEGQSRPDNRSDGELFPTERFHNTLVEDCADKQRHNEGRKELDRIGW